MPESKIDMFNTEPLVIEIENVIKKGLKNIFKDYMDRYELLEKTHKQIMNLPSVRNELNKHTYEDSSSEDEEELGEEDKTIFVSIKDMTHNLVRDEVVILEKRLDKIEKKYDSIIPILDKILDKIQNLNEDMNEIKNNNVKNINISDEPNLSKPPIKLIIQPSIVSACENENIKFEINEDAADVESGNENEETDSDENTSEELEEEEIDSDNEDVKVIKQEEPIEEEESEEDEELSVGEELGEHESQVEEELGKEVPDEDEVETEASEEEENEESESEEDEEKEVVTTEKVDTPEEELEIITIDDVDFCTNDEENGFIYELSEEGEQGEKVGYLKEGEPFFYSDEK
jgi:hypothetical protein